MRFGDAGGLVGWKGVGVEREGGVREEGFREGKREGYLRL